MNELGFIVGHLMSATGPNREIDAYLHAMLHWPRGGCEIISLLNGDHGESIARWIVLRHTGDKYRVSHTPPEYTTSIDIAKKLLPGDWSWRVGNLPSGRGFADLGTQKSLQCIEAATPTLALCLACVKSRMDNLP